MPLPTIYVTNDQELQAALRVDPSASRIHVVTAEEEIQAAYAAAYEDGLQQAINEAVLAERQRIKEIHAVAPGGWRDPAAKLAVASGISVGEFAYKLTLDAIAGGKPLPTPNSSQVH